jgi:hypothetical protein
VVLGIIYFDDKGTMRGFDNEMNSGLYDHPVTYTDFGTGLFDKIIRARALLPRLYENT